VFVDKGEGLGFELWTSPGAPGVVLDHATPCILHPGWGKIRVVAAHALLDCCAVSVGCDLAALELAAPAQ